MSKSQATLKLCSWHKIFLGCLNPRPHSSSADHININQKYYLYCLKKGKKLCLPFILFHYLKKSIISTRTTASGENEKKPRYIPFGRLLSDILIESGLVQDLRDAQCTDELKETTGDVLDAKNMKRIGLLQEITIDPEPENPKEVIRRRMFVDGYPVWSKADNPEVLALYIFSLEQEGYDTSTWNYDAFPDCPPDMLVKKRKNNRKRKSEAEGESNQKKKSKKSKKEKVVELGTYSKPSGKGTSNKPSSEMSTSSPLSKQTQTNSEDILTNQSPTKSADYRVSSPKSPLTQNPSQAQTTNLPVDDFLGPSTPSDESFLEPISPDGSDVQNSTSYSEIDPSSAMVLYQPRPIQLVESINKSYSAASKKALELLARTSALPEKEQADWMEFQEWLNSEVSYIIHSSEQAMELCVAAATKRRDEKLKVVREREVQTIQATQAAIEEIARKRLEAEKDEVARLAAKKKAAEEKTALEDAEKVEFLRDQAEIEQVMLEREELERAEAEKAEALMLAEKARIAEELAENAKADVKKAEQADKGKSKSANVASEAKTSDASRLDAVEQRMDKFSEKQDDMKKQIDSFGAALKMILEW